jgi:hypothetical protein
VVHFGREMGEGYGHASEWNLEKEKTKARVSKSQNPDQFRNKAVRLDPHVCMYIHASQSHNMNTTGPNFHCL